MDFEREQPYVGHGAAMESTLPEFMKRVTEQMAEQKQELAQHKQESAEQKQKFEKLQATVRHMQGRLDESAEIYNKNTITIGQQEDRIETLEERAEAYWRSIQELQRGHDLAFCPLCRELLRSVYWTPCDHSCCFDCSPVLGGPCPISQQTTENIFDFVLPFALAL